MARTSATREGSLPKGHDRACVDRTGTPPESLIRGIRDGGSGIYILCGDGTIEPEEIASMLGKRFVALPARVIECALALMHRSATSSSHGSMRARRDFRGKVVVVAGAAGDIGAAIAPRFAF